MIDPLPVAPLVTQPRAAEASVAPTPAERLDTRRTQYDRNLADTRAELLAAFALTLMAPIEGNQRGAKDAKL